PFGESTPDVQLVPRPAANGAKLAGADATTGERAVAFTQVRGRSDKGAVVEGNGRQGGGDAEGRFASPGPLHGGENTSSVPARDAAGLSTLAHLSVQVADHEADGKQPVAVAATPELTLFLPPQGTPLQSPALTLAGRTHAGYRLTVNGDSVHVNGDGTFSHRL